MPIITIIIFMGSFAWGVTSDEMKAAAKESSNEKTPCRIEVTQVRKSGESSTQIFFAKVKTEEECRKAADLHRTNFAPHVTKQKTVKFEWNSHFSSHFKGSPPKRGPSRPWTCSSNAA